MSVINSALAMATSPGYSMDQILQATQPAKQPGAFRRVLGSVVGGVGNVFAPGIGGMIGSAIAGNGGINQSGLMGDSMQYLQLQRQMNQEQEAYETASSVLKSRHDAKMAAINKMS